MAITPIIILTRDNPEYLYITLKSLTASDIGDNPILIIDDSSQLEFTQKFYSTMDQFDVTFQDWTKPGKSTQQIIDKNLAKTFLYIPQITEIHGVKRKFQVISTPHLLGPTKILQYAIKNCFKLFPKADKCCIIDDNILFNKYWLKEAIEIFEQQSKHPLNKIGIVSVYSQELKIPEYRYKIDGQLFRGKMMLISRALYKEMTYGKCFEKGFALDGFEPNFVELEKLAYKFGYLTITSGPSFIQSLQKRNLSNKEKLLKYQNNFVKPVCWNQEMP